MLHRKIRRNASGGCAEPKSSHRVEGADIASESGEVAGDSENSTQQKSAYVVADNVKDTSDVANPDQDVVDPVPTAKTEESIHGHCLDELLGFSTVSLTSQSQRQDVQFHLNITPRTTESLKTYMRKWSV